jgi:methyl-accepting chemotaxis protein
MASQSGEYFLFLIIKGGTIMKNVGLGIKVIGMVSALLILTVICSGFGIIKIRAVGDELRGIAENVIPLSAVITEITTNQLQEAVRLERALRFANALVGGGAGGQEDMKTAEKEINEFNKSVKEWLGKGEEVIQRATKSAETAEEQKEFENVLEKLKAIGSQYAEYEQQVKKALILTHEEKFLEADAIVGGLGEKEKKIEHELKQIVIEIEKFTEAASSNAAHDVQSTKSVMSIVSILSIIFGLALGIFLTRNITKPLNRVIAGLSEGSAQVASASGQVSSSSQQLAEGASEQAAALEETSSSLEEMASMTKQNADNANQANILMNEANQVVATANQSMGQLTTSMEDISKASKETSKIIKTIDEIAFQTNLLALNAAVEAARAGEAGAGFAVVADEVRNLAMRAAEAAKNTANLIEGTVKKVKDGSALVTKTNEAFSEVAKSSAKVGELVAEIAAASNEQAHGLEQVNKAVAEMDKVIQQNAANAQESASASEELSAQAEQMKSFVGNLAALMGGSTKGRGNGKVAAAIHQHSREEMHKAIAHEPMAKKTKGKELTMRHSKEIKPDQVIPLHDEDFKNF